MNGMLLLFLKKDLLLSYPLYVNISPIVVDKFSFMVQFHFQFSGTGFLIAQSCHTMSKVKHRMTMVGSFKEVRIYFFCGCLGKPLN